MSFHLESCPACGEELLIELSHAVGGAVGDNIKITDHRQPEKPAAKATKGEKSDG